MHRFALTMQDYYRFCPLDRDELEAMFQAKRARFEGMRWMKFAKLDKFDKIQTLMDEMESKP
jgi:energy-coupling factor transporter transmembrane protein EcfT